VIVVIALIPLAGLSGVGRSGQLRTSSIGFWHRVTLAVQAGPSRSQGKASRAGVSAIWRMPLHWLKARITLKRGKELSFARCCCVAAWVECCGMPSSVAHARLAHEFERLIIDAKSSDGRPGRAQSMVPIGWRVGLSDVGRSPWHGRDLFALEVVGSTMHARACGRHRANAAAPTPRP